MSGDALSNLIINSRLRNRSPSPSPSPLRLSQPYNLRFFKNGLQFEKELKELERIQQLQRLQEQQEAHKAGANNL